MAQSGDPAFSQLSGCKGAVTKRHPFVVFIAVILILVGGALSFIRSAPFSRFLKKTLADYVPRHSGIEADFSEVQVKLFPPALSIKNPRFRANSGNTWGVPAETQVEADRVDLQFVPFQVFSRSVRVKNVVIYRGKVKASVDAIEASTKEKRPKRSLKFEWDQLLQFRVEAFSLLESRVTLIGNKKIPGAELTLPFFKVGQWIEENKSVGVQLALEFSRIDGEVLNRIKELKSVWRGSTNLRAGAQGLTLDSMTLVGDGFETNASGKFSGNIFEPENLVTESHFSLNGDLRKVLGIFISPAELKTFDAVGNISLNSKASGPMRDFPWNIKLSSDLIGKELHFKEWKAKELKVSGELNSGRVKLERAVVSSPRVDRRGGYLPGGGGTISILPVELQVFSHKPGAKTWSLVLKDQEFDLKTEFDQVHLHSLVGPALKQVYAMDVRFSGPLALKYKPGLAQLDLKLKFTPFILDNQRLGKTKPLKRVLNIPTFDLEGPLVIDENALRPQNMVVSVGSTRFQLGGKVDFKTGYDLQASGWVDLKDIREIAEKEVRGAGSLSVRVHGPAARVFVDFDTNLQDASYLNLNLGDLRGRITWDDDPNHLLFTKCVTRVGRTPVQVEGLLDFSGDGTADLDLSFRKSGIEDLIKIFEKFHSDIWWFPRTLRGEVAGRGRISGGLDLDDLKIETELQGKMWEFSGERFRSVQLRGGYDQGTYFLSGVRAQKGASQNPIRGEISFNTKNEDMAWAFHAEEQNISDLEWVSRLDLPLSGNFSVHSDGKGSKTIQSETVMDLFNVEIKGRTYEPSRLKISTADRRLLAEGKALGSQGKLNLDYGLEEGRPSRLDILANRLNFSPLLMLINKDLARDSELEGVITGKAKLDFLSGGIERADGELTLDHYRVAKKGVGLRLVEPVSTSVKKGVFEISDLKLNGLDQSSGGVRFEIKAEPEQIQGRLFGEADFGLAGFLSPVIERASGVLNVDLNLGGKLKDPLLLGRFEVEGATLKLSPFETPVENLTGVMSIKQNGLTFSRVEGDLAQGRIGAEGVATLFANKVPRLDLKATLNNPKLQIYPFQFVRLKGPMSVTGDQLPYDVRGNFLVDSALITERVFSRRDSGGLKSVRYMPTTSSRFENNTPRFKLDLEVQADRGILVKNDLFDAELKGQVKIINTLETPRVLGRAETLAGSKILFKDRFFLIQSANVDFDNPAVINPLFNLSSSTDVNGVKVQLLASGRLNSWKPELSSSPVMPEAEILSLLATGMTSQDQKRFSAGDRSAVEQGEAASLLLNSLDFNREVQNKTGIQIQLDESVNTQQAASAFRAQSTQTEAGAVAPKIVIRKQLGERVGLSAGSTVGAGTGTQKEVNAEFKVNRGFSVIGVWDSYESVDTQERQSLGVDLKWQKRFK